VDNNYIDTVIQLPPDLFFGATIATCIIVLKKSKHDNATLFIDASAEIAGIVARQAELRAQIDAIVADLEGEHA
jgi:type I restriction enzyme M protein